MTKRAVPWQSAAWLLSLLTLFHSCGDNPQESGIQDFPNTLETSANALFALPSSLQDSEPSVSLEDSTLLSRISVAVSTVDTDFQKAIAPYLLVPQYIHTAEALKSEVKSLMYSWAGKNLPDSSWSGSVDGYDVISTAFDSTLDDAAATYYSLSLSLNEDELLQVIFLQNDSGLIQGSFTYFNPEDSVHVSLELDETKDDGDEMSLVVRQAESMLADSNSPSVTRIFARRMTASGQIRVMGSSYLPTFQDSFWGDGAKIYAFGAISDTVEDQAVLRIAFADADSIDNNAFSRHQLHQTALQRCVVAFREAIADSTTMLKLIYFSLDSGLSLEEALDSSHLASLETFGDTLTRTAKDFDSDDLEAFFELNASAILDGHSWAKSLRVLYFLVHIESPLYLTHNATVVGFGKEAPTGFSLSADLLETLEYDNDFGNGYFYSGPN
ncbi:MAG TPA: hypothetical protein VLM37_03880 [Fibrobacteraceae bacterium]|nr:hypothetical protein [Fibrobacteraceae bacterium]